ncbi:carboxylesterase/lipase family protein [Alkalicaulis satelles]|nr:carboxylesterase family protein [Alkalicaulis satelles]
MIRIAIALACAVSLAACGERAEIPAADPDTARDTAHGAVTGFTRSDQGVHVWRGVPFAAAPVGDLRWRAPRPAPDWDGVRETLHHPEPCIQIANALSAEASGTRAGDLVGSEDCLYLNIYAPAGAGPDNGGRPVMVWIHGGANVWGHASQYDGGQLAADQDVVVVVVQYRLGLMGFFAHPALMADAQTPDDAAGNFALLDLIAALDWVQANINAFGGDAGRVTIFGESAGGHNVAGLMAAPQAAGLFHRAIIQSGSFDSVPLEEAQAGGRNTALEVGTRITGGEAGADALRLAPLGDVYATFAGDADLRDLPRMIADGVTLPRDGLASAFTRLDGFNAVPLITGVTRDEMKLFNAFNDTLTRRRLGFLVSPRDPDFYEAINEYQSRVWRVRAVDDAAAKLRAAGHDAVWGYRFDWDEAGSFLTMDLSRVLGAAHAMEIPFVFNHFDLFGRLDRVIFNRSNRAGRQALATSMGAYWAAFARDGDPGDAGGITWPALSGEDGPLMRFDSPASGGPELMRGADSIARITADIAADPRLDAAQRCQIARAIGSWVEEAGADVGAALDCPAPVQG